MAKVAWTTILFLFVTGCAGGHGAVVYAPGPQRPAANLALGPSRDHVWLAETFAGRSSWPSVRAGYVFDDVSSYTEVIYDDQSYYGGLHGGGYTREAISVRSGVLVR
jgi:hypothetical protein